MRRRNFIQGIVGSAATGPLAARAQQPGGIRLIGVLMGYAESDQSAQSDVAAFRAMLAKLGWTEGGNIRIELRWGAGDTEKIRMFAKELVEMRPDAIVGQTTAAVKALVQETRTVPIVFANVADPIGSSFATNLARPSGNITGFSNVDPAVGGKWVELLKEIAPRTERVAVLSNPATAVPLELFMPSIQAAASTFAVPVSAAPVHAKDEIEGVIAEQARTSGSGLIVTPDPFNAVNRDLIIGQAARYGVPAIFYNRFYTKSGGLISYGADFAELNRQAAVYIDRILKGAKPADLPIQTPTKYELIVNLKTAKALGLMVPPLMLGRADDVIE
jgi:putative tryptophan/tyrosine transport system substrate-binding protein